MLTKQAKTLNDSQIRAVTKYLEGTRNGLRNQIMFLLSLHGFRAKEVADLKVTMLTDGEGKLAKMISLTNEASKGKSGRTVPMSKELQELLGRYLQSRGSASEFVIVTERSEKFSANAVTVWFKRLYTKLGFTGCSSHSGRRSFITRCARKVSQAGGSMRDVMALAGHTNLQTTQRYVEQSTDAQEKLIELVLS